MRNFKSLRAGLQPLSAALPPPLCPSGQHKGSRDRQTAVTGDPATSSCLWTPAGNLLQINTNLFVLLKCSSKKVAARSRTRGNPAWLKTCLVGLGRGREAQGCQTESYCRSHAVFLALSDGFFHQKKKGGFGLRSAWQSARDW